jgi:hypothetical protein
MMKIHEVISLLSFLEAPTIPIVKSLIQENSTGSMVINNNITVSEIEEPQLACSIEDENAQPSESKHSLPRFTESAQPIKKKLINDPHLMHTRLMDHHHEKPGKV